MKQWMKKRKSRGFTLVELLIVIVIIGILAGSLLLVMGSGTDKANATKIVSDLRTLKAAQLMHYADNDDFATAIGDLSKYLDRDPASDFGTYGVTSVDVRITGVSDTNIQSRISDMASDSGLSQVTSGDNTGWKMKLTN